jgi:hypothetical protein
VPSPIQSAGAAITGNVGNLGGIYNLGSGINQFQNQQAIQPYIANLPNYQAMVAQQSGNIGSELQGKLPQDVINQITQRAAERGVATGTSGSPNENAEMLRSLGLTSLGMEEQGASDLQRAIGETPNPGLFSPESMLVSPEQQQAATAAQHLYLSSPVPEQAAQAGEDAFKQGTGFGSRATPGWAGGVRPTWAGGGTATGTAGGDPFNIPGEVGPVGALGPFDDVTRSVGTGSGGNQWNWTGSGWSNAGGRAISAPAGMADLSPTSSAGGDILGGMFPEIPGLMDANIGANVDLGEFWKNDNY